MKQEKRVLAAYEKARALEREIGKYGAVLTQDALLEKVVEIRQELEFVDGEESK